MTPRGRSKLSSTEPSAGTIIPAELQAAPPRDPRSAGSVFKSDGSGAKERIQVVATVEIPAHSRATKRRRGEETSRNLERIETTMVHAIARKKYACGRCHEGVGVVHEIGQSVSGIHVHVPPARAAVRLGPPPP